MTLRMPWKLYDRGTIESRVLEQIESHVIRTFDDLTTDDAGFPESVRVNLALALELFQRSRGLFAPLFSPLLFARQFLTFLRNLTTI
jgi:hypothetical protein